MRSAELAKRNFKEVWRDPLSLGLAIALPLGLLLILQALGGEGAPILMPTMLAPGIVLFGGVMLMFSAAMTLAKDRETALMARLLTTPLRAWDFVGAYSLPYLVVAIIQAVAIYAVGALLGLEIAGNPALVALILLVMAVFYIGLGMILGSVFTVAQVSGAYAAILLLTIFGGAWMNLEEIGGVFERVASFFPFAHALDGARDVMAHAASFDAVAGDLAWVIGYAAASVGFAIYFFRRRMVE